MSWSQRFDVPIKLPNGTQIATLSEARQHLLSIPCDKHDATVVAAVEAVLMAANGDGPMMHASIGVGLAVSGSKPTLGPNRSKEKLGGASRLADAVMRPSEDSTPGKLKSPALT